MSVADVNMMLIKRMLAFNVGKGSFLLLRGIRLIVTGPKRRD